VGSEENWWDEHRIDAKGEAQRLWHQTQSVAAKVTKSEASSAASASVFAILSADAESADL
jgi:hypothetical protein